MVVQPPVGKNHNGHSDDFTLQHGVEHLVIVVQVVVDGLVERAFEVVILLGVVFVHRGVVNLDELVEQLHALAVLNHDAVLLGLANHIAVLAVDVLPDKLRRVQLHGDGLA